MRLLFNCSHPHTPTREWPRLRTNKNLLNQPVSKPPFLFYMNDKPAGQAQPGMANPILNLKFGTSSFFSLISLVLVVKILGINMHAPNTQIRGHTRNNRSPALTCTRVLPYLLTPTSRQAHTQTLWNRVTLRLSLSPTSYSRRTRICK